ncbi:MAG TPA: ribonuclease P protein subunit [Nitrososphaerales archaeon]|nr:ribonuclease P protein subunit [Nitrososphaerales archaeon]
MSVVGTKAVVIDSKDGTKLGRKGEIVLETARTLLLKTADGTITIEKAGTVLQVEGEDDPLIGDDIKGRLEDRIRGRRD